MNNRWRDGIILDDFILRNLSDFKCGVILSYYNQIRPAFQCGRSVVAPFNSLFVGFPDRSLHTRPLLSWPLLSNAPLLLRPHVSSPVSSRNLLFAPYSFRSDGLMVLASG